MKRSRSVSIAGLAVVAALTFAPTLMAQPPQHSPREGGAIHKVLAAADGSIGFWLERFFDRLMSVISQDNGSITPASHT